MHRKTIRTHDPRRHSAPVYGEPDTSTLYAPGGPQSAFGPPANAYYPGATNPNMALPQANGIAQPGELQSLNYSQGLGNLGNMQLNGSPMGSGALERISKPIPRPGPTSATCKWAFTPTPSKP